MVDFKAAGQASDLYRRIEDLKSQYDKAEIESDDYDKMKVELRNELYRLFKNKNSFNLQYSDISMDVTNKIATRSGQELQLRSKEFKLLLVFLKNPEKWLTKEYLFSEAWGYDFIGESNVIEVYIRYLRSKLKEKQLGKVIQVERGRGYRLQTQEN